jgi:sarcosine oxidase/L-pipecolate oxidase
MLVANRGVQGEEYVRGGMANARRLANPGDKDSVEYLGTREEIEKTVRTGGGSGEWGYINRRSGWADAEASMCFLQRQVVKTNRVSFVTACVESLLISPSSESTQDKKKVTGVRLADNSTITADLTIVATGAWTGKLIDLRGRAQATGQVLCYLDITDEEQERLKDVPTLLNMSTGMFIIPPRNNLLKVARHGYGYSNPTSTSHPEESPSEEENKIEVSLPRTKLDDPNLWVPQEGEDACRNALSEMIPWLADRPFTKSKICWYTDTPTADFIITYHPEYDGLFVATGGSGHGFKFLPVIGDKIVDCMEGKCPEEFKVKWAWKETTVDNVVTEDGSRGGKAGMILDEEVKREARVAGNRTVQS